MASTDSPTPPAQSAQSHDQPLFSYDDARLSSSQGHIRLLDLAPSADRSAPIVCHLSCHAIGSSSDAKPFTALSYAWGSPARTHQATVDGKQLGITTSLDEALRHLRESASVLTLWIDQICINQGDNDEKSNQVALMPKVFGTARQVLIWLGPAADDSDRVMELWRDVGLAMREQIGDDFLLSEMGQRELSRLLAHGISDESKSLEGVERLHKAIKGALLRVSGRSYKAAITAWHSRAWFTRVWVLQEYILSRETPVYVCGDCRVDAGLVHKAVSLYSTAAIQVSLGALPLDAELRRQVKWMVTDLEAKSITLYEPARKRMMLNFNSKLAGRGDSLLDLLSQLYMRHQKNLDATDERDRIFALLALASDSDTLGLKADYSIEDSSLVFSRAAKTLIQKAERLELLSLNQFPKASYPGLKTPLPTWAPDWRSQLKRPYCDERNCFSASQHSSLRFVETLDDHILGLQGIVVCTIAKIEEQWVPDTDAGGYLVQLYTIDEFCKESAALGQNLHDERSSKAQREGAVWRVPIGDRYYSPEASAFRRTADCGRTSDELHAEYARVLQMLRDLVAVGVREGSTDGSALMKHPREYECLPYMFAMIAISRKRAFLTKAGYVGLGPGLMTAGDAVVIFAGAEIPHILRQTSDKRWEYVGEAYCDGIMDGEAWVEEELETFYLV